MINTSEGFVTLTLGLHPQAYKNLSGQHGRYLGEQERLTPLGEQQADAMGAWWGRHAVRMVESFGMSRINGYHNPEASELHYRTDIYTSYHRQVQHAGGIALRAAKGIIDTAGAQDRVTIGLHSHIGLSAVDLGLHNGRTIEQIAMHDRPAADQLIRRQRGETDSLPVVAGAEHPDQLVQRVYRAIREILGQHSLDPAQLRRYRQSILCMVPTSVLEVLSGLLNSYRENFWQDGRLIVPFPAVKAKRSAMSSWLITSSRPPQLLSSRFIVPPLRPKYMYEQANSQPTQSWQGDFEGLDDIKLLTGTWGKPVRV